MSTHLDISIPLLPGQVYHIYNRGNERRRIFFEEKNYPYFLRRYGNYTKGFFKTYGYCLMENHFHLLIKVCSVDEIIESARRVKFRKVDRAFYRRYVARERDLTVLPKDVQSSSMKIEDILSKEELSNLPFFDNHPHSLDGLPLAYQIASYVVNQRFRRFLLSYAKAINKQENRTGSLFQKPFRRKCIMDVENTKQVLTYILHNPIHHDYTVNYKYPWSSFNTYFSSAPTSIPRDEVINWFGERKDMIDYLDQYKNYKIDDWKEI